MDTDLIVAIVGLIPGLIWATLGVFVVARLYRPFREDVLPRLTGVQVMGLRLDIKADDVQRAVEAVPRQGYTIPAGVGRSLLSRVERAAPVLLEASICWIDDSPASTLIERQLLSRLAVFVEPVGVAAEVRARAEVRGGAWDVVVADAARPGDPDSGTERTLLRLRADGFDGPAIFYVSDLDAKRGVPGGAFGITNRPDELLHLVIDALERRRMRD